jgi:putative nucleotidyltransferase with HDIG domain
VSEAGRIESALERSEPVRAARAAIGDRSGDVWIVGGAVRDALLGREIVDVDLAVGGDAATTARRLAKGAAGYRFELSREYETWRVSEASGAWEIDVATLREGSLERDLLLRDFTLNSIAVPLAGGEPVDPAGGVGDALAGRLHPTSAQSFEDDPLRLLRAARLAAAYGLELSDEALELARASSARAAEPAGERRFAALRRIVAGPEPIRARELMDELGVTEIVLPPLAALRGVEQSANHHLDVHEHTVEVMRRWLAIEGDLETYAGGWAPDVARALERPLADELSHRDGIRFAAILHDIGKPPTRTERDGFVGFRGHDDVGAEMILDLCRELRTSRRFAEYLAALTRHHLVLGFMTHERPLCRRRIWDYLMATDPVSLDVTLLTIADRLSAQGSGVPEEAIQAHLELSREMIGEIVTLEREGRPRPLLDGAEIGSELALQGRMVGEAVRELAAAQFAGEVDDRRQALEHLRSWLASRPSSS